MMTEILGFLVRIWPWIALWVLGMGANLYIKRHRDQYMNDDEEGWLG